MPVSRSFAWLALLPALGACSSDNPTSTTGGGGSTSSSSSSSGTTTGSACAAPVASFDPGSPTGHPDPLGAKAAKQARAGRITDLSQIAQPAHGRQQIEKGDYLLINDKIAVVIEDKGDSDGYAPFGGEILAIDAVGDDGRPRGVSMYNETLIGFALQIVKPTSVGVIADGSDGKEAILRVTGPVVTAPFLVGPLKNLFPTDYTIEAAYDYVLAPGAEKVKVRVSVRNDSLDPIDFGVNKPGKDEFFGFFQYSRSQTVTAERGYGDLPPEVPWIGFDGGDFGFVFKAPAGEKLYYGLEQSGFELFWGDGYIADACAVTTKARFEIIAGGPGYDGLREAVRRSADEAAWREIKGTVKDGFGAAVEDAWVHGLDDKGQYLTRARTDATGAFTLHAPPGQAIKIVPQKQGYPTHPGADVAADAGTAALAFDPHATLHVVAVDEDLGTPVPARIQVIPALPGPATPEAYGVLDEVNGRLWQELAVTGDATLVVPPGQHRIIVSHGYEWELYDNTVTVAAGEKAEVTAAIAHSVDSTGAMCADFHIHSIFSADSNDSVEHKVKGAIADGLDIPVSSEHEWVIDFQPVIEKLGLTKWAFGMPSSELTTFKWGHFGVVPIIPKPSVKNHGAVDWIGKSPAETFAAAHALPESPVLIINHPRSSGFGGYFSSAAYDRKNDVGDPALWSTDFEAIEVFNDSDFEDNRTASVADWFSMLNHGRTVWAVGSSDSHHLRTSPVGYPRTCLRFGHDDPKQLTPLVVRDAVAKGASTISGGLYMTVVGPNGERPGEKVTAADGQATFLVTVEAPSSDPGRFAGDHRQRPDGLDGAAPPHRRGQVQAVRQPGDGHLRSPGAAELGCLPCQGRRRSGAAPPGEKALCGLESRVPPGWLRPRAAGRGN
ncbi:MAG: CehA/McbA family metallohydrolase [Minicystis sp.]